MFREHVTMQYIKRITRKIYATAYKLFLWVDASQDNDEREKKTRS